MNNIERMKRRWKDWRMKQAALDKENAELESWMQAKFPRGKNDTVATVGGILQTVIVWGLLALVGLAVIVWALKTLGL